MNTTLARVSEILAANRDKRVLVLGTFCSGKSTLAAQITGAIDMDKRIWPLSDEDAATLPGGPWQPATGESVAAIARRKIKVEAGRPVLGTVLLPCDLVVYLDIDDDLLVNRVLRRGGSAQDLGNARSLRQYLREAIQQVDTPHIVVAASDGPLANNTRTSKSSTDTAGSATVCSDASHNGNAVSHPPSRPTAIPLSTVRGAFLCPI